MDDKYTLIKCDDSMLQDYIDKQEISLFRFGSAIPIEENGYECTYAICENKTEEILGFITFSIGESDLIQIDEFEILKSKRRQGVGKRIVEDIKKEVKKIELYPRDEISKRFWEKCGFSIETRT